MMLGLLMEIQRVKVDLKSVIMDNGAQSAAMPFLALNLHQQYVINSDMSLIVVSKMIQHKMCWLNSYIYGLLLKIS